MVNNFINTWQRYKLAIICSGVFAAALSIYLNPQAFLNLWLTRDQQGMLLLKQENPNKAALTFSHKHWVAFSFYTGGDFEQAAQMFTQLKQASSNVHEQFNATFAQANALAHAGQYFEAAALYQTLLNQQPNHTKVQDNLALINKIIKKMKKAPGKKELSNEIAKNLTINNVDKKPSEKARIQSSQLWLEQVQQNPAKFLRKKFQQEHQDENQ